MGILVAANRFAEAFGDKAWQYALAVHIFSWYVQIHLGHGVFEGACARGDAALLARWLDALRPHPARHLAGRKPALLDSFFQSLVLAPFFVYMEVGFFLGFRQEFHKQLRDEIGKRRVAWRKSLKADSKPKAT